MTKSSWQLLLLTGFGLGRLRPAPGSWGSLLPVGSVILLIPISSGRAASLHMVINTALAIVAVAFVLVCLLWGGLAEAEFAGKDPSQVVADEVVGQCLALWFLPWRDLSQPHAWWWNLNVAAVALISFRIMDITKPPPARAAQALPGGRGILVDDVVAGVYAMILTQFCVRNFWPVP